MAPSGGTAGRGDILTQPGSPAGGHFPAGHTVADTACAGGRRHRVPQPFGPAARHWPIAPSPSQTSTRGTDPSASISCHQPANRSSEQRNGISTLDSQRYPLFSARPGFARESRQRLRRSIQTTQVNPHYWHHKRRGSNPCDLLPQITCPVRARGRRRSLCPIGLVEQLVAGLAFCTR